MTSSKLQSTLNGIVAALGVVLILATGVALATSGGESGSAGTAGQETPVAADKVQIKDFKFDPPAVTVAAGSTITWTNADSAPHTATSGTSPTSDGTFDTDVLRKGESKKITVAKPGTYAYFCSLHPFMKATVIAK